MTAQTIRDDLRFGLVPGAVKPPAGKYRSPWLLTFFRGIVNFYGVGQFFPAYLNYAVMLVS
jgi:hypothetical protein